MNTIYWELPYELGKDELGWNINIENKNPINLDNLPRSLNLENEQIRSITTEDLNHLNDSIQASTKIWKEKEEYRDYKIVLQWGGDKIKADSWFLKRISEQYANNDSLEWAFINNEQTQEVLWKLFSNITNNVLDDIAERKRKLGKEREKEKILNKPEENIWEQKDNIINNENNVDGDNVGENSVIVETISEFLLHEYTEENFERFLCSPEWLRIIREEYEESKDPKTGKINVDINYLSNKLHTAWWASLQEEYDSKHWENDDKFKEIRNVWRKTLWNLNSYIKSFSKWEITEKELIDNFDEIINSDDIKDLLKNSDFKEKIRNSIRIQIKNWYRYMNVKDKYSIISLNSWSPKMDLEIKSYLYLYGKIFYDNFPKNCWSLRECENDLTQVMEAILLTDETIKYNPKKHSKNKYYKNEKIIEDKSIDESIRKKEELKKRMQEMNAKNSYNRRNSREWRFWLDNEWKSLDLKNASWLEIASSLNLWKKLSNYKINKNESIDENMERDVKGEAFQQCFRSFLDISYKEGQQMKSVIDESQMREIYDFKENRIDSSKFGVYKDRLLKQWFNDDDISKISEALNTFIGMMNDATNKLLDRAETKQWMFWEKVKTYAVWAIIDNIKAIFSQSWNEKLWSLFEWFQFDNNSPVDIIWNDMLIHGKMNWVNVSISYKLDSWEIYINSYFQKKLIPPKITIWNNEPDYKIWQIDSFDKILDTYYKLPTIENSWNEWNYKIDRNQRKKMVNDNRLKFQELFGTKLDIIWEMAKYHIERQSVKNSVIKTFCKTFNIKQEKLEITEWSNLYSALDIISNSNTDTLATFSKNMETFLSYFWLRWWDENNILDEKRYIIFDESGENSDIKDIQWGMMDNIKNKMKNFNTEKNKITNNNTWNFDNTYNLWIAGIIKEYMTEWTYPNRKLDNRKMGGFLERFNIWLSELNQKKQEGNNIDEIVAKANID